MDKRPEQIFLEGEHTDGHGHIKRMLNIASHERDAKLKPQLDTTSHQSEWPSLINQQTSAGEYVEKREP